MVIAFPQAMRPLGYQQVTVGATAVALTLPITAGVVRMAVVMVEDNPIRYRDDGVDPTATVGMLVQNNVAIELNGAAISTFRAIRTSSDAKLSVHYYG